MPTVLDFVTSEAPAGLLDEVRGLLDRAFDGDLSDEDWEHTLGGSHVVVTGSGVALAHAAVVPRTLEVGGRRLRSGYLEGVATLPGRQGAGLGSLAMSRLTELLRGEFEFGALSTSAHDFYAHLGWERWQGPTFVRAGAELLRTADEDDGIMVLRFGSSRQLDLRQPITCEARAGDDW